MTLPTLAAGAALVMLAAGAGRAAAQAAALTVPAWHGTEPLDTTVLDAAARAVVGALAARRFDTIEGASDATVRAALPADRLAAVWESLVANTGDVRGIVGTSARSAGAFRVSTAVVEFARATLDVHVTYGADGTIAGLRMTPHEAAPVAWSPPSYADTSRFDEREVTVGAGEWALPATLTVPRSAGPYPAVVLVHGSGPEDRDETVGGTKVFKDLAWGLATRGIVVLRYEKRTRAHAATMAAVARTITVKEETIDDAIAAVDLLRHTAGVDPHRIVVVGHSLGATLAPRIAETDPAITGIVIMAGITRPLADVILAQTRYLDSIGGSTGPNAERRIHELAEQVARVHDPALSPDTPADSLPLSVPAAYWLDLRAHPVSDAARRLRCPVLVLQGGRDYQVTADDYAGWRAALAGNDAARFHWYPALNHLFVAGTGPSTPAEYARPGHVDAPVIDDLSAWLLNLPPRAAAPGAH